MAQRVTPDEIRNAVFRTSLRGVDRAEVNEMLAIVAQRIEELEAAQEKLRRQLDETPSSGASLETEFESVGREVSSILQSAREAAESMRERASLDAARWRREALEEADTTRKEAAADSEALRRDAWVTGSEVLDQAQKQAEAMRAAAERDVLTIMGEAEREAHRLTSGARREAEDLIRNATMDAEKMAAEAAKKRNEIIESANRQASTAQERARALEARRDELLVELENVRSTLTRMEGSLAERREALDMTRSPEPSNVRVVHPPPEAKGQWELGETVRVVPPGGSDEGDLDQPPEELVDPRVERARQLELEAQVEPDPEPEQQPEPEPDQRPEQQPGPEPDTEPAPSPEQGPSEPEPVPAVPSEDELQALFASLRGAGAEPPATGSEDVPAPVFDTTSVSDDGTDWIAVRDSRLLPITNRALRGVKKAMTELQNVALDSLRTDDAWRPDEDSIAESVHAELVAVWSESFAAGHSVAEEMAGERLQRPPTPLSSADQDFASDLAAAVTGALDASADGPRERQSAASRVFRVWRSDEAERRIRNIALLGYESGIEKSRTLETT